MRRPLSISLSSLAVLAALCAPLSAQEADGDPGAYLAAREASNTGNYRQGTYWYDRALATDPKNPQLLEGAVLSSIGVGDFEKAARDARTLIESGSHAQSAYLALLAEQAAKGDFSALIADIEAGHSVGAVLDQLVTAWAQLGDGKMSDAIAAFDKVAENEGLSGLALYHKALALASAGDFEGAETILASGGADPLTQTRRGVLAHVQVLSQLEQNQKALTLLDTSFGTDPNPAIDAIRAQLQAGETLPFDTVRNATDGLAEVFQTLASALGDQADTGFLMLYTSVAGYLRPDLDDTKIILAQLLERQGQLDLAAETYAQIPAESPNFHIAEIGRAETLIASGKVDAGIEVLQALTRSHPDLIAVHIALADALRSQERFKDSIASYDTAIALLPAPQPQNWALFFARGISLERTGELAKAEADFRKALELSPDQPSVLNYLGYSFVDRGEKLDEALGMIQRAVAAEPQSGAITDSLAWAYFRLGRYQDAVEPMERASLLEPVDPVVTDHLGDVYWAVGRKLEAAFQWRRALSFDPAEKDADRIRRKLEIGLDEVLKSEGAKPITEAPVVDGN